MFTAEASQSEALKSTFSEMRNAGWNPDDDTVSGVINKLDAADLEIVYFKCLS